MRKGVISVVVAILGTMSLIVPSATKEGKETNKVEITLPEPEIRGETSLEECIQKRRSRRHFTKEDLTLKQVSQLVWSAQGITDRERGFRAAPSAGALYPLEIYIVRKDGFYLYRPGEHKLMLKGKGDRRDLLAKAALGQSSVARAPIDIVICAVYERVTAKYGKRGMRYTHMEAGHAAQNIHLQAVSLGLGSVPVGAFIDGEVAKTLNLPEDHRPLYIIPTGHPSIP